MTNCKNCGAPLDSNISKCPYCDTEYATSTVTYDKFDIDFNYKQVLGMINGNIAIINEVRRIVGLEEVTS